MSEPTYRVELVYDPTTDYDVNRWQASIYRVSDDSHIHMTFGETMEQAFDRAQEFVRRAAQAQHDGRTVLLSEDGDILDPHEVTR